MPDLFTLEKLEDGTLRGRSPGGGAAIYHPDCAYCMSELAALSTRFPSHKASHFCESGKRDHCTCDACW